MMEKRILYIDWILFFGLCLISLNFVWKVIEQYNSKDTSFKVYDVAITEHPTVTFCFFKWRTNGTEFGIQMKLGQQFNIEMKFNDDTKINLDKLGTHQNNDYVIDFKKLETAYYGTCYSITPRMNRTIINGEHAKFKMLFPWKFIKYEDIPPLKLFFTSEKNSIGIVGNAWKDGEIFDLTMETNTGIDLSLKPRLYINSRAKSNCRDESFYECFESRFLHADFSECPKKCTIGKIFTYVSFEKSYDFYSF